MKQNSQLIILARLNDKVVEHKTHTSTFITPWSILKVPRLNIRENRHNFTGIYFCYKKPPLAILQLKNIAGDLRGLSLNTSLASLAQVRK